MRVVTFNIRYGTAEDGPFEWKHRRDGLHQLLLALDADLYCFQEALHFQVQEIAQWLTDFTWVGVGRDDGAQAGEFAPIFAKSPATRSDTFWLSPFPDIPGTVGWGARIPRICTWAEIDGMLVANIHLDHESPLARQEGAKVVLDRIHGRSLICGDFNAELSETFFDSIIEAGYRDLAPGSGGTYNEFTAEPISRIDYIFGRGVTSKSGRVIRSPLVSDHWPVVVEIE